MAALATASRILLISLSVSSNNCRLASCTASNVWIRFIVVFFLWLFDVQIVVMDDGFLAVFAHDFTGLV